MRLECDFTSLPAWRVVSRRQGALLSSLQGNVCPWMVLESKIGGLEVGHSPCGLGVDADRGRLVRPAGPHAQALRAGPLVAGPSGGSDLEALGAPVCMCRCFPKMSFLFTLHDFSVWNLIFTSLLQAVYSRKHRSYCTAP